ncbi:hypothetical protein Fmac_026058 [Flemingia macrophylla]|uniref:Uncharacterized protein n=1 Tax=Flemingia macrophylla TaxID=520843 RepID=A0ABD1LDS5_9FABA
MSGTRIAIQHFTYYTASSATTRSQFQCLTRASLPFLFHLPRHSSSAPKHDLQLGSYKFDKSIEIESRTTRSNSEDDGGGGNGIAKVSEAWHNGTCQHDKRPHGPKRCRSPQGRRRHMARRCQRPTLRRPDPPRVKLPNSEA